MNYHDYQLLFDQILSSDHPKHPYDSELYMSYTKLNRSRMKRWDRHLILDENLIETIQRIQSPQQWIIITEPWCGDAAHIIPFWISLMNHNALITYDIVLRDTEPFLIQSYLTNGSKSIPKLVVRNAMGNDLLTWGPRPHGAQLLLNELKAKHADYEETKIALQHWYNEDKGVSVCRELNELFRNVKYSE